MNNNVDKFCRQKRTHSSAIIDEFQIVRQRKLNIHQYEEITSTAKFVKNSNKKICYISEKKKRDDKSETKVLNQTNNSNKNNPLSPSPIKNTNLNISNISNVAETNSLNNSKDSTFCDLIEDFSGLDLSNKDEVLNELHYAKTNSEKLIISSEKQLNSNFIFFAII